MRLREPAAFPLSASEGRAGPGALPGLALWLDAADPATTFQDAAFGTAARLQNDPVGGWRDKSGLLRHATQSSTAPKPTLALGASPTGLPALSFDAVDDTMALASASAILQSKPGLTVLVAARALDTTRSRNLAFFGGDAATRAVLGLTSSGSCFAVGRRVQSTDAGMGVYGGTYGTAWTQTTGVLDFASNAAAIYRDGAAAGSASSVWASGAGISDGGTGASNAIQQIPGANMAVGEVVVYARVLATSERQRVEAYLRAKWGTA